MVNSQTAAVKLIFQEKYKIEKICHLKYSSCFSVKEIGGWSFGSSVGLFSLCQMIHFFIEDWSHALLFGFFFSVIAFSNSMSATNESSGISYNLFFFFFLTVKRSFISQSKSSHQLG